MGHTLLWCWPHHSVLALCPLIGPQCWELFLLLLLLLPDAVDRCQLMLQV
jgi:hypothetical protein